MRTPLREMRKKYTEEQDGWQITLADMMTLLLSFFVLITAMSVVDLELYDQVSESMKDAMGGKTEKQTEVKQKIEGLESYYSALNKQKTLKDIMSELQVRLVDETEAVRLKKREDGVALELSGSVFFDIGRAELTDKARELLTTIAEALWGIPYGFAVEGHSDNLPIRNTRFPSNWELSAARASRVARFFIDKGFPREKFKVIGLADTEPLVPNVNEEGNPIPENQKLNRRVVLLIKPEPETAPDAGNEKQPAPEKATPPEAEAPSP